MLCLFFLLHIEVVAIALTAVSTYLANSHVNGTTKMWLTVLVFEMCWQADVLPSFHV